MRILVVRLIKAGMKQREVARLLELNYATVHYILEKYSSKVMVVDRDRSKRPMISTERERRVLCRYSTKNPLLQSQNLGKC